MSDRERVESFRVRDGVGEGVGAMAPRGREVTNIGHDLDKGESALN